MGWIHTGGGWYENEETGDRIRGKTNLPVSDAGDEIVTQSPENELVCMTCDKVTAHTQQPVNSPDWAIYNCNKCGGKTRVSLK